MLFSDNYSVATFRNSYSTDGNIEYMYRSHLRVWKRLVLLYCTTQIV